MAREECPRALDAVVELGLDCALECDELAGVFDFTISLLLLSCCFVLAFDVVFEMTGVLVQFSRGHQHTA